MTPIAPATAYLLTSAVFGPVNLRKILVIRAEKMEHGMSKKGLVMSRADAEAHQRRHFGTTLTVDAPKAPEPVKVPKPRQNATEREYGLILEAQKRRGEILDYRPFGMTLEWGCDPETGKPMRYTTDFTVFLATAAQPIGQEKNIRLIETKGYVHPQDLIRWKGCRAEWGHVFEFQMHQKSQGEWRRLF